MLIASDRGVAAPASRPGRGFTLIELLVVIMIIALVIAITLPALAGARTAAKRAATRAFIQEVLKAGDAWRLDKQGKAPGYFSERDMGRIENGTRGFTAMQNVMVDLMGGVVENNQNNDPMIVQVGPVAGQEIWVNTGLMGSQKGYFAPDKRFIAPQDGSIDGGTLAGLPEHQKLPSLVDAWGDPLLLWAEDQTAIGNVTNKDQFALVDSGNGDKISRFYWNSNAGLLKSTSLGKLGKNQNYGGVGTDYSLLGGGGLPPGDLTDTMIGILGNASYPNKLDPPLYPDVVPTQAKGRFVVISAGPDGVYYGSRDKGYNRLDHQGPEFKEGVIRYLNNFFFNGGGLKRYTDDKGNPTTESVADKFDDILVSGGN